MLPVVIGGGGKNRDWARAVSLFSFFFFVSHHFLQIWPVVVGDLVMEVVLRWVHDHGVIWILIW